ncbi:MAG: MerR family transcriptional regulator [Lachnospiraceae bacterium]|nr:MerR family transcriptional regulator [Oribacterium sp.]MBQ6132920.1 MerR family transcriptional regulator [Lachnospiraceae bacterium]
MIERYRMEDEKLYTIREVSRICGISRATLLRMEEAGFDVPRKINPESGYRYYDAMNILKIQRYLSLTRLGLTQKDILAYYNGTMDKQSFLTEIKEKLDIAQRCVDEFNAYFSERESISFSFYNLPEMTCYCFPCPIREIKKQVEYNYKEIKKMYDQGFKPYPSTPMFCAVPGLDRIYNGKEPNPYTSTICMSVCPDELPNASRVIHVKSRQAFSMLYHGDSDYVMENGGHILLEEMKKRKLKPMGPLIGINVVGVFFGNEIAPEDYVFRFAIPVE